MAIGMIRNIGGGTVNKEFDFTRTTTSEWTTSGINTGHTVFWQIVYGIKIHFSRIDAGTATIIYKNTFDIKSDKAKLVLNGTHENKSAGTSTTTYIYISTDNGSNWTSIGSTTSLTPSFNIDLSPYKGLTLKFRVSYYFNADQTQHFDVTNMKLTY